MTILRTIKCDVCGMTATEGEENQGWIHWGNLNGIALDGVDNPSLCRECLINIANFINALKHKPDAMQPLLDQLKSLIEKGLIQ